VDVIVRPKQPIKARGWWIVGVAETPGTLIVAPLGRYDGARAVVAGGGLARFLGLGGDELAAPGAEEALAGAGWVTVDGRPAWEVPAPLAPRALLVVGRGPAGPVSRYGPRSFEDGSGERLARALGLRELSALLGTFETAHADALPPGRLRGRHVVALTAEAERCDPDGAASFVEMRPGTPRAAVSAALLRATLAARSAPGPRAEVEAEVEALAAAGDAAVVGLPHPLRRGWMLAGEAGLAWPGSAPGAGWQLQEAGPWPRNLSRDLSTVIAEVMGPPWRATGTGPAGRVSQECTDQESAILVAERLARTMGGMTPWDRRDVMLARTWREVQTEGGA